MIRLSTRRPRLELLEDRAHPSAGSLDPTFSGDGLTTPIVGFVARDMAVQPDGKVILVGYGGTGRTAPDFAVTRLNANGTLDTAFGTGGIAYLDFKGKWDQANAVAIQADGKIVAAGYANVSSGGAPLDTAFAVARFNANGSVDNSFGTKGKILQAFGSLRDTIADVAIQPDGKVVAAGATTSFGGGDDFIVARYTTAGKSDTTFSGDGVAVTNFGGADSAGTLVVQPDGKIVAAGTTSVGGAGDTLALVRYTATGGLDAEFGTEGKVLTGIVGGPADVLIDAAANILVGVAGGNQFAVARFLPGGGADPVFGAAGVAVLPNPTMSGTFNLGGIALQADGQIVAAGTRRVVDGVGRAIDDFALARLSGVDGGLDGTFGTGGWAVTDFGTVTGGPPSADRAGSVAVMADGRIVVAGETDVTGSLDVAVARYLGDPPFGGRAAGPAVAPPPESEGLGPVIALQSYPDRRPTPVTAPHPVRSRPATPLRRVRPVASGGSWHEVAATRPFAPARLNPDGSFDV